MAARAAGVVRVAAARPARPVTPRAPARFARGRRPPPFSGAASPRISRFRRLARSLDDAPISSSPVAAAASGPANDDDPAGGVVVAVVTTPACPHCRRAKSALADAGVPFAELDASRDPDGAILEAARLASGSRTVPQVFVGGVPFGGADETEAGIASGALRAAVDAAVDAGAAAAPEALREALAKNAARETETENENENERAAEKKKSPTNERSHPPEPTSMGVDAARRSEVFALAARLARRLEPRDYFAFGGWRRPLAKTRACVRGDDLFAAVATELRSASVSSDADADGGVASSIADLIAANALTRVGRVGTPLCTDAPGVRGEVRFPEDAAALFRLADHARAPPAWTDSAFDIVAFVVFGPRAIAAPACLNARDLTATRIGTGGAANRDGSAIAASLKSSVDAMHDAFLSEDGRRVNYAAMRDSEAFDRFLDVAAELQGADLQTLSEEERKAFFINAYNAMVFHVAALVGPPGPKSFFDRLTYFARHEYDIGGYRYSLDDVEHGALRGNRPGAASLGAIVGRPGLSRGPFATDGFDGRLRFAAADPIDPRVHFALVCGAKSCPPVRCYDAANLEAQLAAAAEAFVEGDVEVVGEAKARRLRVSKIIGEWYRGDFGATDDEIARRLSEYVPSESAAGKALRVAVEGGEPDEGWAEKVTLVTREYDWSPNA